MKKHPILFISHEASPTGAPFLLLHLLRWLRTNTTLEFEVALSDSGSLEAQFAELAPVTVFRRPFALAPEQLIERFTPYRVTKSFDKLRLRHRLRNDQFALVYSNTLVNGKLLERLPDQTCPLISHVHELDSVLRRWTTPMGLAYTLGRTTRFIAGSKAVAQNLTENHNVDATRVNIIHEFIPSIGLDLNRLTIASRRIRAELNISEDDIVIGAVGTVEWRKGYDFFIMLAIHILGSKKPPHVHFVWVGHAQERNVPLQIAYDLRKLGLENYIHFVGQRTNYLEYMAMFDVFCLTSREDPFPLVVLECAALAKPVVCFDKGGGSPEFVEDDCGFVVPYLNVSAMAARVLELAESRVLRETLGRRGQSKVRENHDVSVSAPRIVEIIDRLIKNASHPP